LFVAVAAFLEIELSVAAFALVSAGLVLASTVLDLDSSITISAAAACVATGVEVVALVVVSVVVDEQTQHAALCKSSGVADVGVIGMHFPVFRINRNGTWK